METHSLLSNWKKALAASSTNASFAALIPTVTKPATSTSRIVFDRTDQGTLRQNTIIVLPYGGDDDNDQVKLKVSGWNLSQNGATRGLWVPTLICEVLATLSSTLPGIANEDVVATEFFADTITLTTGIAIVVSGTSNVDVCGFVADVSGYQMVEVAVAKGTGGDHINALVRFDT